MKEVGKIYKIYKGFFGDELPEDAANKRREICKVCPFNSINCSKLSLIDSIRNQFTNPFCTLCKCQIHEKTGSALEECAMYMIGEEKKWFKIKLEVMGEKNLDLIQVGDNLHDISIEGNKYVINLGKIDNESDTDCNLILTPKELSGFKFESANVSCGCTKVKSEEVEEGVNLIVRVEPTKVGLGAGYKTVDVVYTLNGERLVQVLKIKYFKV